MKPNSAPESSAAETVSAKDERAAPAVRVACVICGSEHGRVWNTREMMFGMRTEFAYFECDGCECLQLLDPPADLSAFYPSEYYSLTPASPPGGFRGWLRHRRNRAILTGKGMLGKILSKLTRYPYAAVGDWIAGNPLGTQARVLDVGCGSGSLIHDLALVGYPDPLGVDPFIDDEISYPSGARVLKAEIDRIEGEFDVIILNHSLEHVPDQIGTLRSVARLLSDRGACLVRTPISSSYAWRHYRADWVQLDPPRHLFVHSLDSLERAARIAGLRVVEARFDSDEFQFMGSELYQRDIPATAGTGVFSKREVRSFRRRARRLNRAGEGDQVAAVLQRI